ncbi:MAG: bifunctional diaminohydroxyphosphoribosylaminopyrimidine deaminase/5-amino-6-(5-phosphoribosylamino)uracil reductase RibD [candidate division Zixibacteria bacterium]
MPDFEKLMSDAFNEAKKGLGYTSPNPPVGAILYKNGQIIAYGYHKRSGKPHAEIEAIRKAGQKAKNSTLIVTLEPCSHQGRTPPCTDAIIDAGIKTVVGAVSDKNPAVAGSGYRKLKGAGIEVINNVLRIKALEFYAPYFKFITTGMPFITLKFAQSIDGRIAASTGDSRWISSPQSLKLSHELRAVNDAILIGNKTLELDDSRLTTRSVIGLNPIRIILSGKGKVNLKRRIFNDGAAPTYIATSAKKMGAGIDNIIPVKKKGNGLDLNDLLKKLGEMGIASLLVEGGSGVLTSFLKQKLADRVIVCIAPIIIGKGIESIGELGVRKLGKSLLLDDMEWKKLGPDMILNGKPIWR